MLLFRSEEEIEGPRGGVMTVAQLHELAARWYGDRLDPGWRPRTPSSRRRSSTPWA